MRWRSWNEGLSLRSISRSTGISRATLHDWREHPVSANPRAVCPRCAPSPALPEPQADYAYLLGLYLGDGCISLAGARDKEVWKLRIACADAWPGLRQECERAMSSRPAGQQGAYPAAPRLHRGDQLFPALAVPIPAARTGSQAPAENRAAAMAANHCDVNIPAALPAGCSTPTAIAGLTAYGHGLRTAITGMNIRDICSATSQRTFCGCAVTRWIGSGWRGASPGRTRYRWHGGRRWRGSTSSSAPSTEGAEMPSRPRPSWRAGARPAQTACDWRLAG